MNSDSTFLLLQLTNAGRCPCSGVVRATTLNDVTTTGGSGFGANSWLVEEMYEQYQDDPDSVSESWRQFFAAGNGAAPGGDGDRSSNRPATAPAAMSPSAELAAPAPPAAPVPAATSQPVARTTDVRAGGEGSASDYIPPAQQAARGESERSERTPSPQDHSTPLKGAAAAIATNMERSLSVPTATSFRNVPAKLLEVNRNVINGYRTRSGMGKVSFTHIIGYAIVRAITDAVPAMRNSYTTGADGKPRLVVNDTVNMGLAVDVDKGDGTRTLVVPVVKDASSMTFAEFLAAYEEIIAKVKANKLTLDDFQGANVTLTNPGTIGTVQSVPRLMPGQGVIVGVGSIDYPAEFEGADRKNLSSLGISKVVTVTSTYDHRIIQGAESGLFLKRVHELLLGEHDFYEDIFSALDMPYEAVKWHPDVNPIDREESMLEKQKQVATVIRVYRVRGHLIADLDPLHWKEPVTPVELDPFTYGLTIWDLDREFLTGGVGGVDRLPLGKLLGVLRDAYCRTIGVEYMHIQDTEEQRWIQEKVERKVEPFDKEHKRRILERLNAAEAFEKFLATKYVGTKRFGLEGAESFIPILDEILTAAADAGLESSVLGMAHRGRLNVLSNIMGKSYDAIFREFEGYLDPNSVQGSGDVKYHLGATGKHVSPSGADINLELAANPSHLETVGPIVVGMARAMQDRTEPPGSYPVLPVLVHGDAAFAGQGVVAETLAMSDITGYRVGGTIHLIINNQIGFTTAPEFARSSLYCSDVAKTVQAPIFHVNGDDPEACVRVARLAFEYRQRFNKDVVIDMWCYRRHGHNEGDDPSYTQPLMYRAIADHRSVRKLYVESLVKRGDITDDEAEQALADFHDKLQVALDETRAQAPATHKAARPPKPMGVLAPIPTGVDKKVLTRVFESLTAYPEGFTPHPKLAKQFEARAQLFAGGEVEWATAEALAFGSLLHEGHSVRLAGQDSRRGTFSQRHAALIDYETGRPWIPLDELGAEHARFWVYDSLLSEYAALVLRVRLRPNLPGDARAVGSAVRRLHQQCASGGRPVHRRRRGQVGSAQRARAAPPAWLSRSGPGALLGPHRALPHRRRRGQHPALQRDDRRPVLPLAAPAGVQRATHAVGHLHAEGRTAAEANPLAHRRADRRIVPRGARRSRCGRSGGGRASGVLQWQGGVGCDGRARQARSAGGGDPCRAALSAADRAAARHAPAPVRQRQATGVAAGGAREHGRVELHRASHVAGQGAWLRPPPCRPGRVRQPGDGVEGDPRPGARRPDGRDVRLNVPCVPRPRRPLPGRFLRWRSRRSHPVYRSRVTRSNPYRTDQ